MFLGHFAAGLVGKRLAPALSLGALFAAAQLADLVWPNLVLAGVERVEIRPGATPVTPLVFERYPWSHGLVPLALWGALVALGVRALGWSWRAAAVMWAVVVSHWLLDFASHLPDLPLAPGLEARFGLGLWHSRAATLVAELGLLAAGLALYSRATRARDRIGRYGLAGLVALLVGIYVASLAGPPPPNASVLAGSAQAVWLLVALGWWVDRHREPRPDRTPPRAPA
jgi:hypothetical protein